MQLYKTWHRQITGSGSQWKAYFSNPSQPNSLQHSSTTNNTQQRNAYMRIGVPPHKTTAHKQSCLTLYRALLKQAQLLPPHLSTPLTNLIGQRFHLDKKCQSPPTILSALSTARSALRLITSTTNGDPHSTETLTSLLSHISDRAKETHNTLLHQHSTRRPPSPGKLKKINHLKGTSTQFWKERIPESPPILSRPVKQDELPRPERPRRVPYLTSTQGIPFLRYKSGPQSPALSHALRSMYGQTMRRWNRYDQFVEDIGHGMLEDNWDALVHKFTGVRDDDGAVEMGDRRGQPVRSRGGEAIVEFDVLSGNVSWAGEVKGELEALRNKLTDVAAARMKRARELRGIVVRERALAEEEKVERKRIARGKWMASQVAKRKVEDRRAQMGSVKEVSPASAE